MHTTRLPRKQDCWQVFSIKVCRKKISQGTYENKKPKSGWNFQIRGWSICEKISIRILIAIKIFEPKSDYSVRGQVNSLLLIVAPPLAPPVPRLGTGRNVRLRVLPFREMSYRIFKIETIYIGQHGKCRNSETSFAKNPWKKWRSCKNKSSIHTCNTNDSSCNMGNHNKDRWNEHYPIFSNYFYHSSSDLEIFCTLYRPRHCWQLFKNYENWKTMQTSYAKTRESNWLISSLKTNYWDTGDMISGTSLHLFWFFLNLVLLFHILFPSSFASLNLFTIVLLISLFVFCIIPLREVFYLFTKTVQRDSNKPEFDKFIEKVKKNLTKKW